MRLLFFSPAYHGALGIWDEIISWGVFITVAIVIGAFLVQQWRERDEENEEELTPLDPPDPPTDKDKDA